MLFFFLAIFFLKKHINTELRLFVLFIICFINTGYGYFIARCCEKKINSDLIKYKSQYCNKSVKIILAICKIYFLLFLVLGVSIICCIAINNIKNINVEFVKLFILLLEIIYLCIYIIQINYMVAFYDDFYYSSGFEISYNQIKSIEILKTQYFYNGALFSCILHFIDNDIGYDKFLEDEYNFLQKMINEKENVK